MGGRGPQHFNFCLVFISNCCCLPYNDRQTEGGEAGATPSVDEWMNSDETKISKGGGGINPTPGWLGERERGRKGERGGRQGKKDSLSAVFCQGRNYTFTEVFSSHDGLHRSSCWIYGPIFNMKYRQWAYILPVFTCLLCLCLSIKAVTPLFSHPWLEPVNEDVVAMTERGFARDGPLKSSTCLQGTISSLWNAEHRLKMLSCPPFGQRRPTFA